MAISSLALTCKMSVSNWFNKRTLKKSEQEKLPCPTSFDDLFKSLSKENSLLLKTYLQSKIKNSIKDVEEYVLTNQSSLIKNQPSNFQKKLAKDSLEKDLRTVIKSLVFLAEADLTKAIDPKQFNSNIKSNVDSEGQRLIDHSLHLTQHPAPEAYTNFLNDERKIPGHWDENAGISPKLVHEIKGYNHPEHGYVNYSSPKTFMTKPYHQAVDSEFVGMTHFPTGGWATMTTKDLYHAGGIGDLVEDVSVHEHEGTPVTVHRFTPNAETIFYHRSEYKQPNMEHLPVKQIAVMDYLTNNTDRHLGNLLVHQHEPGKYKPLAIDHERAFGYGEALRDSLGQYPETPFGYMLFGGLNRALDHVNITDHSDLTGWWKEKGRDIQKTFAKNLSSIKDDSIRKHLYDNFMSRWNRMDSWVDHVNKHNIHSEPDAWGDFEEAPIKKFKQPLNQKFFDSLPKNPKDAIATIYDVVNRKHQLSSRSLNQKQVGQINEAIHNIVKDLDPQQLADIYKSSKGNPHWNSDGVKSHFSKLNVRPIILNHLYNPESYQDGTPAYKLNHIQAISDIIDSDPKSNAIARAHSDKLKGIMVKHTKGAA